MCIVQARHVASLEFLARMIIAIAALLFAACNPALVKVTIHTQLMRAAIIAYSSIDAPSCDRRMILRGDGRILVDLINVPHCTSTDYGSCFTEKLESSVMTLKSVIY